MLDFPFLAILEVAFCFGSGGLMSIASAFFLPRLLGQCDNTCQVVELGAPRKFVK